MHTHVLLAIGAIALPFITFHWKHSLFALAFILLIPGCAGDDAPHDRTDTTAHAAAPPGSIPESMPDTSATAAPEPTVADSVILRKPAADLTKDTTTKTAAIPTVKTDAVKPDDRVQTARADGDTKESTGSSGCPEVSADLIAQGRKVFTSSGNCVTCHGMDAKGNMLGPDLTDTKWIHISGDYASIAKVVRTGVNLVVEHTTPMPPMGGGRLSDDDLCAVAAYVWSLSH